MQKPRISLICVVLNVAPYIEEVIRNTQAQSYPHWELVIVDGASTDGTQAIVERMMKEEPRIKFKSEPDEGPWDATDKGLDMAEGEFIMVVGGQDGFLDNDWFAKCIKVFDEDKSVSLVWAPTRAMDDDGTLLPEENVSYSHFMKSQSFFATLGVVVKKIAKIIRDLIKEPMVKKKVLLKKIFAPTALLRVNFFTRRSFPNGIAPQKEDWFRYWLDTGIPFSDQPICVSKRVYEDCVPRYIPGSKVINDHRTSFFYNFNSKGYLSYYIPVLAGYGREHPGSSGDRIPMELFESDEKYMRKVLALRNKLIGGHGEMIFLDRDGKETSRRKY
jgi:glycosyltransferase involved in cell wall biosynthesis